MALAVCIGSLGAASAGAQGTGNGFLFGPPSGSFTLRGGYANAAARGDLIDFTTTNLTLDRHDFSSPELSADFGVWLAPKSQLQVSLGYAGTNHASEFRDYEDNNNQPITQTTKFQRVPLSVSYKQYLTSPGRSIGSLAWIPSKLAPYLGAGVGAMWYRFKQSGDFVDFQTNDIFNSILVSSSWTPMAQAMAGVDYTLSPRFALNAEGTYRWANAHLGSDFSGFDRLDLSGLSTTVGLTVRY
jgi:outer membrane protein W